MARSPIRNNIRALRFNHNEMTQQDLANAVDVTRQTIISLEQEKYSPSLELAFKIANVLEKSIEEIFTYEKKN